MNPHDYCPRGRELFAEYRKWEEQWERGKILQIRFQVVVAWQKFRDHLENCEICNKEDR